MTKLPANIAVTSALYKGSRRITIVVSSIEAVGEGDARGIIYTTGGAAFKTQESYDEIMELIATA